MLILRNGATAAEDRLSDVVAGFEAATAAAIAEMQRHVAAALASEKPVAAAP